VRGTSSSAKSVGTGKGKSSPRDATDAAETATPAQPADTNEVSIAREDKRKSRRKSPKWTGEKTKEKKHSKKLDNRPIRQKRDVDRTTRQPRRNHTKRTQKVGRKERNRTRTRDGRHKGTLPTTREGKAKRKATKRGCNKRQPGTAAYANKENPNERQNETYGNKARDCQTKRKKGTNGGYFLTNFSGDTTGTLGKMRKGRF
jgi:hypothetical protein